MKNTVYFCSFQSGGPSSALGNIIQSGFSCSHVIMLVCACVFGLAFWVLTLRVCLYISQYALSKLQPSCCQREHSVHSVCSLPLSIPSFIFPSFCLLARSSL